MLAAMQLSCGHKEIRWSADRKSITLWREHGVYHVKAYDHLKLVSIVWNGYRTHREARKEFLKLCKEHKADRCVEHRRTHWTAEGSYSS